MTDPFHEKLTSVFLAASDLPKHKRSAFLRDACQGNPQMLELVQKMLEADESKSEGLSQVPLNIESGMDVRSFVDTGSIPDRIGPYTIKRRIGVGGMGIVYEAEQSKPNRSIALKVLRWVDDPGQLARFELEAEVLGWLQHPAIAHVYGTGKSDLPEGPRPWIAMELVHGVPIDQFIHDEASNQREILDLLIGVLEGIAHAHSKGVVHRDLKPANILVDQDGKPRIVDFGVARLASSDASNVQTKQGDVIGTLAYMSPEQVGGDPSAIDTRSDIYSMGVIAYELLSGERAIVPKGASVAKAMRSIAGGKPVNLNSYGNIPPDVCTIVHKALAREKEARYPTAEAFAEDLKRYLSNQVILARPPSTFYQLRCFAKRNRLASLAIGASILMLIGGGTLSTYLFLKERKANTEKDRALDVADEAKREAVKNSELAMIGLRFYGNMIAQTSSSMMGTEVSLAELIEQAALEVPEVFKELPEMQVQMLLSFSTSHYNARRYKDALREIERARPLVGSPTWNDSILASAIHLQHGLVLGNLGLETEALQAARMAKSVVGEKSTQVERFCYARACERIAIRLAAMGDLEGARVEIQLALDLIGKMHLQIEFVAHLLQTNADILTELGRYDEAMQCINACIKSIEKDGRSGQPLWLKAKRTRATANLRRGKPQEALRELIPLPNRVRAVNGEGMQLVHTLNQLGQSHSALGKPKAAALAFEEALDSFGKDAESNSLTRGNILVWLGLTHSQLSGGDKEYQRYLEAEEQFRKGTSRMCSVKLYQVCQYLSKYASDNGMRGKAIRHAEDSFRALEACPPPSFPPAKHVEALQYWGITIAENEDWVRASEKLFEALDWSIANQPQTQETWSTLAHIIGLIHSEMDEVPKGMQTRLAQLIEKHKIKPLK